MERLTNRIKTQDREVIVYTKGKYEDTTVTEMSNDDIRAVLKKLAYYEDAEEERGQLDKALNELKRRREYDGYLLGSGIVESAYSSGYKKAIDDIIGKCKSAMFSENDEITLSDIHQGTNSGLSMAIHFAEQLKKAGA